MKKGLYYLAAPYQGSEEQQVYRVEMCLQITAEFLRHEIHLFAPLLYTVQIMEKLQLPSLEERRALVMPYLFEFLKVSKGMIVVTLDGWQDSWGVQQELHFCQNHQIPVYKIDLNQVVGGGLAALLSTPLNQQQANELFTLT